MLTPAIWFPTVKTNSGTDSFTEQLVEGLNNHNIRAEIAWLPHHTEYLPWLVAKPKQPKWANIIHTNTWLHSKFQPKGSPIVTTLHHCVQDQAFSSYKSLFQKIYHHLWITQLEKQSIKNASCITTVSQYTSNRAREIFGVTDIKAIYNGINQEIFQTNNQKIREFKNPKFKLLFVGNSSIRKGFDLLPMIMDELGEQYELFYTATPPKNLTIPKNMKQLPYQKTVFDLAQTYNSMDALIFPSRLEGFGLVVAEAMACGLPVIATNSSALPELIEHKRNGLLCDQDNILSFVNAVKFMKDHPHQAKIYSEQSILKVKKLFTVEKMIQSYITLYEEVLVKYQTVSKN